MKNDIKHLPNGDFEVVPERQTKITPRTDSELPQGVFWKVDGKWVMKGWLMPQVR